MKHLNTRYTDACPNLYRALRLFEISAGKGQTLLIQNQTKTKVLHHYMSTRMASIKNTENIKGWQEHATTVTLLTLLFGA